MQSPNPDQIWDYRGSELGTGNLGTEVSLEYLGAPLSWVMMQVHLHRRRCTCSTSRRARAANVTLHFHPAQHVGLLGSQTKQTTIKLRISIRLK